MKLTVLLLVNILLMATQAGGLKRRVTRYWYGKSDAEKREDRKELQEKKNYRKEHIPIYFEPMSAVSKWLSNCPIHKVYKVQQEDGLHQALMMRSTSENDYHLGLHFKYDSVTRESIRVSDKCKDSRLLIHFGNIVAYESDSISDVLFNAKDSAVLTYFIHEKKKMMITRLNGENLTKDIPLKISETSY